jgi:F-type H+-transporting ATPase subunit b
MNGMLELLHFNPVSFGLTVLIFVTVLIVLSQIAWKPILKALDERDDKIREDLDSAEKSREETAALLEEQKKEMAGMRDEAKKIREEAQAFAERQKAELLQAAKLEAESVLAKARQDIVAEKDRALEDVKKLAVEIGVDLAGKLISKEVSEQDHRQIIDASLTDLETVYKKQAG